MFYLIGTIVLNTVLFTLFKVFPKYKIDTLQAIVANYFVTVITGSLFLGRFPIGAESVQQPWFPWAIGLGVGFISVFNLIAWRTSKEGMTATTIANKISLVIPVIAAYFLYSEQIGPFKIAGIILAAPAVYFASKKKEESVGKGEKNFFWIALLFLGSGLLDTVVKYAEQNFLKETDTQMAYTIHVFAAAACSGFLLIIVLLLVGKIKLASRNLIAGVVLGIPNFFSLYFLIRLLHSGWLQSSAAIPINNIGIVLLSALVAMLFFGEKASRYRVLGLALAVVSILLIALSDLYGN